MSITNQGQHQYTQQRGQPCGCPPRPDGNPYLPPRSLWPYNSASNRTDPRTRLELLFPTRPPEWAHPEASYTTCIVFRNGPAKQNQNNPPQTGNPVHSGSNRMSAECDGKNQRGFDPRGTGNREAHTAAAGMLMTRYALEAKTAGCTGPVRYDILAHRSRTS